MSGSFRRGWEKVSTSQAEKDGACFECHAEHADLDHVWTQFYPILRKHLE